MYLTNINITSVATLAYLRHSAHDSPSFREDSSLMAPFPVVDIEGQPSVSEGGGYRKFCGST